MYSSDLPLLTFAAAVQTLSGDRSVRARLHDLCGKQLRQLPSTVGCCQDTLQYMLVKCACLHAAITLQMQWCCDWHGADRQHMSACGKHESNQVHM